MESTQCVQAVREYLLHAVRGLGLKLYGLTIEGVQADTTSTWVKREDGAYLASNMGHDGPSRHRTKQLLSSVSEMAVTLAFDAYLGDRNTS